MADLRLGLYEHLLTRRIANQLHHLDPARVQHHPLDPADAHQPLTRHLAALISRALQAVPNGDDKLRRQVDLANRIAQAITDLDPDAAGPDDQVADARNLLHAIAAPPTPPAQPTFPARPTTPLSTGALLVNGRHQPRIGHEVTHEMASAERVDLLCAFIKWHGLRIVEPAIRGLVGRGGTLRVITTTYLGATDQRALDRLAELGAEVKVSYETRTTRLHAKAWLFRRDNGLTTAYVGSSNLSKAALVDGVEWNVRISNVEQPHVIDTFKDYWNDPAFQAFEAYEPGRDGERLRDALRGERSDDGTQIANLDVRPYPYQSEILAELDAERQVHGRHRNLVVMATGTGKTVVAALDYRRLNRSGTVDSLLFVAHQEQILRQSLSTFRQVVGDGSFGELLVGGNEPRNWTHVFASIQSLHRREIATGAYDMVIVDEFHHAEAPTYARLLERLRPRVLLGLTATPDRADGGDVRRWFDGRAAVELHLWEALERQLLAPFQYFGVHDEVDDADRLDLLARVAAGERPEPGRLWDMLHFDLWGPQAPLTDREQRLARLWAEPARCAELRQLAGVLRDRIHRVTVPVGALRVHARYSRNEACAAFGMPNPGSLREGVKWLESERADLFFVTLVKSERHYSPTTMYADRAVTDRLFQWESQSTTSAASATGQRYVHHASRGSTVHLFVRETRVPDRDLGAPAYLYAGPMAYRRHTGDRPMRIVWELAHPLPADLYAAARAIAA
ncbi:DUF3427 domain-containing protein [Micromonospora haikouensis]|uniref:DUF3427 domain-containing protein n=1 Tax=Micromonospora haikouensis TaxID=686309 RepID=UPI0033C0862F